MKASRELVGPGPLSAAERVAELRAAVVDASIECVLAEAAAQEARVKFAFMSTAAERVLDTQRHAASGSYLDAAKREHIAKARWQHASRELVTALRDLK